MAEPAPAKMKPILDPQVVAVVAILFGLFVVLIEGEVGCRLLADRYLMSIAMRGFRCEIQFQQSSAEPF